MDKFIVTLDVDWAPDFVLDEVASIFRTKGVKSTWFFTHASPVVENLRNEKRLFEIGIHPNFLNGSTQGETPEEIMSYLLRVVPEAISMRTHSLVWSSRVLETILEKTNVRVDASLFTPGASFLRPFQQWFKGKYLVRIPTVWSDDYQWQTPEPCWDMHVLAKIEGLKVICFHPIHIYLNSASGQEYENAKTAMGNLKELRPEDAEQYIHAGQGTRTFLLNVLDYLSNESESYCVRDIYHLWQCQEGQEEL